MIRRLLYVQDYEVSSYLNRSEIWSNIKGGLLGLKWVGNTTNNEEYTVLEGSAGRKIIRGKANGKQLTLKTATPATSDGKL